MCGLRFVHVWFHAVWRWAMIHLLLRYFFGFALMLVLGAGMVISRHMVISSGLKLRGGES